MRVNIQNCLVLAVALTLPTTLLFTDQLAWADQLPSGSLVGRGIGGIVGAASGAIAGASAGASAGADAIANSSEVSLQTGSVSTSSLSSSSLDASSSSSSSISSSSLSPSSSSSSVASTSVYVGPSTAKPLIEKVKDIFKGGKEIIKNTVENVIGDDKTKVSVESSVNSSGLSTSSAASSSASVDTIKQGSLSSSRADLALAQVTVVTTSKPGILGKITEIAKKTLGVDSGSSSISSSSSSSASVQTDVHSSDIHPLSTSSSASVQTSVSTKDSETLGDKMSRLASRVEERANEVSDKYKVGYEEHITRPISTVSGSGLPLTEREKYLLEMRRKQELAEGKSYKELVAEAKAREYGSYPYRSEVKTKVTSGSVRADERTVTGDVMDRVHEISKIPVEKVHRALFGDDEKDPLLKVYDESYELIRKPIDIVAKPVEAVLKGAFKTTEEAKREHDRMLMTSTERAEAKLKEEKARREDRSVAGVIADKTHELATKPLEVVLKPFDHAFGLDKNGKKNPLLKAIDELYSLSKKPIDSIAKPFERMLRQMGNGTQMYEVAIRFNTERDDPKIVTRLADGALNIADRVITKPLAIVMKPFDHAFGYDEPGKKNPIIEATHSLKNATKVGFELFTKPIDRIIKEIAIIGDYKTEAEREAAFARNREHATRIVHALDELHKIAQAPFEIIMRPINRVLGLNKEGRKEPFLRAWDVIHQVVRTPIQVISEPVEEAILGNRPRKGVRVEAKATANGRSSVSVKANGVSGTTRAGAQVYAGSNRYVQQEPERRNVFIEGIKRVEKFATKPIEVATSPIRKLLLGEDSEFERSNSQVQAKAKVGSVGSQSQVSVKIKSGEGSPDKLVKTLEKMNNVMLKPLEIITQPISDMLSSRSGNKSD